ncbi:MAG: hypothetical protein ABI696_03045 [Rubrivivax sp.]
MKAAPLLATSALHQLGQSLWLDDITRTLLRSGTLARYIRELSATGLTSNPTIPVPPCLRRQRRRGRLGLARREAPARRS